LIKEKIGCEWWSRIVEEYSVVQGADGIYCLTNCIELTGKIQVNDKVINA